MPYPQPEALGNFPNHLSTPVEKWHDPGHEH